MVRTADSLEAPGALDDDLVDRVLGVRTLVDEAPLGEFLIPRFE